MIIDQADIRVFYAHPYRFEDDAIDEQVEKIRQLMRAARPHASTHIISGRDDYNAHFRVAGNWDSWIRSVATSGRYNVIVVPDWVIAGRATKGILDTAHHHGITVYYWNGHAGFTPF